MGNGSSIHIYQDRWLLGSPSGKLSLVSDITPYALVSILIDSSLQFWRNDEVDRLFLPVEATLIKAIPLSFTNKTDHLFWPMNLDGVYSMRSGYNLILEEEAMESPGSSNAVLDKKNWKGIWSLKAPRSKLCYEGRARKVPTRCWLSLLQRRTRD